MVGHIQVYFSGTVVMIFFQYSNSTVDWHQTYEKCSSSAYHIGRFGYTNWNFELAHVWKRNIHSFKLMSHWKLITLINTYNTNNTNTTKRERERKHNFKHIKISSQQVSNHCTCELLPYDATTELRWTMILFACLKNASDNNCRTTRGNIIANRY